MGNLFGKKKESRVTNHDRAVLQMKQQRDKLKQYQHRIEKTVEAERLLAGKLLKEGRRDRAKLLLKKKRYQEQLLQHADGQLENLETLIHDLEFTMVETQVLQGLKIGNDALKKLNELVSIEEVERIIDETREGVEKQREIDALLSGELTSEDETAVEEEFAALIAADEDVKVHDILPEVPTDEISMVEIEDKEDELVKNKERIHVKEIEKGSAEKRAKKIAVPVAAE